MRKANQTAIATIIAVLIIFLYLNPSFGETNAAKLLPQDEEKVKAVNEAYVNGWLKNDPEAVLKIFAEEAVIIPQGRTPIKGIESIKSFWWPAGGGRTTITSFTITTDEIDGDKEIAFVRGTFKFSYIYEAEGKKSEYKNAGNYLMIMRRQADGEWKITHRMWGDLPRE